MSVVVIHRITGIHHFLIKRGAKHKEIKGAFNFLQVDTKFHILMLPIYCFLVTHLLSSFPLSYIRLL